MKALISLFSLMLSLSVNAAVSITLTEGVGGPSFVMQSEKGEFPVPDGSLVRIGTFETAPNPLAAFWQLDLAFQEFGTTQMGHPSVPGTGRISKVGILGAPDGQPDSYFVGKKIYLWVYGSSPQAGGVYQGIYGSSINSFVFGTGAYTASIANLDLAIGNAIGNGGAFWQTSIGTGASGPVLRLVAFPEPSATWLALTGTLICVGKRRKGSG